MHFNRVLKTGMVLAEEGCLDFSPGARNAFAGFSSNAVGDYSKIPAARRGIFFDLSHDSGEVSKYLPGFFPMLGGPSYGSTALAKIIQYYQWRRVVVYYLTEPGVMATSEVFAAKAAEAGIDFELKLRETAGPTGLEADYENLLAARSNVYIFFGGPPVRISVATSREHLT
jgi:hypothetical protein